MSKVELSYCPEHLRLARLSKGFSQPELGEMLSTSRQYIHQLESGIREPSGELLPLICEVLSITPGFLYRSKINELKPEQCHFRKRRTTTQSVSNQVLASGTILELLLDIVQTYVDIPSTKNVDVLEDRYGNASNLSHVDIEKIASEYRALSGLSQNTPISNVTDLIESSGVFITTINGVSEKVDALSFSRKYRVILRNSAKESSCRQRFDLAHELGHLIMHNGVETGDAKTESQADWFASCLLFPVDSFFREFSLCVDAYQRLDWSGLIELKRRWGVSLKSIIYRAGALGLISPAQYRSANIYISKNKWSKVEVLDDVLEIEEPSLLFESIMLIQESLGISLNSLAKMIGLEGRSISDLFDLNIQISKSDILPFNSRIFRASD